MKKVIIIGSILLITIFSGENFGLTNASNPKSTGPVKKSAVPVFLGKNIIFRLEGTVPPEIKKNIKIRIENFTEKYLTDNVLKFSYDYLESLIHNEVKEAIKPYGYFQPSIKITLKKRGTEIIASAELELGRPIVISDIDLEISGGKDDRPMIEALKKAFPLQKGDILNTVKYTEGRDILISMLRANGYLDLKKEKEAILIDSSKNEAHITLIIKTDSLYRFGQIELIKSPLNDEFIARYLTFHEGERFSLQKVIHSQSNLLESGYFRSAFVELLEKEQSSNKIPARVQLSVQKKKLYQIGGGYSIDTGPHLSIDYTIRYINSYGHSLHLSSSFSTQQTEISSSYVIPGKDPVHSNYSIVGLFYTLNPQKTKSKVGNLGLDYIARYSHWQYSGQLEYQIESYQYQEDEKNSIRSHLLVPSLSLSWHSENNKISTDNGLHLAFSLQGANKNLLSSINFLQLEFLGKGLKSFENNSRLIATADFGITLFSTTDQLPPSKQFYLGGINSIRGYKPNSIGPGRNKMEGSIELQQPIYRSWYAAIFFDFGNTFDSKLTSLKKSYGTGVVWRTPIGNARIYLAFPVIQNDQERQFRFLLSFGPDI